MPLPAEGLGRVVVIGGGFRVLGLVGIGGRPILPTVRAVQRGREIRAHGFGLFPRLGFLRVQNAREQNPGQLRHNNYCKALAQFGAAHHIADAFDEGGEGLRRGDGFGRFSVAASVHHDLILDRSLLVVG
jgi:hypothetical protein